MTEAAYAAVDCGSNSFRLLAVDSAGNVVQRSLVTTRLGRSIPGAGRIDSESFDAGVAALSDFADLIGGGAVAAVATSAVRDASNAAAFVAAAEDALGHPLDVISGQEEGRLTFLGATSHLPDGDPVLVLDIGGGSTEFSVGRPAHQPEVKSLQLGAVRLTSQAMKGERITEADLSLADELISSTLSDLQRLPAVEQVVAVAGTATSLAAVQRRLTAYRAGAVEGTKLSIEDLESLVTDLGSLTLEERRAHPHVPPGRAEIIVAGALILARVLRRLGHPLCSVSEHDILEGVLLDRFAVRVEGT